MLRVTAPDGQTLAVHDLGGNGPVVLLSHATGFHGRVFGPLAAALGGRHRCVAPDHRAHGASHARADDPLDWESFGRDVLAVVEALGERPVLGFGHSMGGTALLLAESAAPGTFARLALFEPIVRVGVDAEMAQQAAVRAASARRRRRWFPSLEEASANFAGKPPLNELTAAALAAYVEHGWEPDPAGGVRLRCEPEHEARVFESATALEVRERLTRVRCPVLVLAGGGTDVTVTMARALAGALPDGAFARLPEAGHMGPLSHPDQVASRLVAFFATVRDRRAPLS